MSPILLLLLLVISIPASHQDLIYRPPIERPVAYHGALCSQESQCPEGYWCDTGCFGSSGYCRVVGDHGPRIGWGR
ncbi:unnamed protein product [Caenorhabditis angaria]|uniref:WAP domain-containing protein n=1 Tax=Caenorhabditis angaria TaxID=860376 RepID=A0A9P1MU04_9PELO|nr:unnamed protein product [Caenorhabditis angaria]